MSPLPKTFSPAEPNNTRSRSTSRVLYIPVPPCVIRFVWYGASIDQNLNSVTMTNSSDKNWKATFSFQRPAADRLVVEGEMDGRKVRMQLVLLERQKFLLINRGFHWVRNSGDDVYPFENLKRTQGGQVVATTMPSAMTVSSTGWRLGLYARIGRLEATVT